MLVDVAESVRLGLASLPEGFCRPEVTSPLAAISNWLPRCVVVGTLETRLAGEDRLDYQVCVTARSGGRDAILGQSAIPVDAVPPNWRRSVGFLRFWATPGSLLYRNSPAAWLEFDCVPGNVDPPTPFPFFSLHAPWDDVSIPASELIGTAEEGFDALADGELPGQLKERVRGVLLGEGRLIHGALRPTAGGSVVRLITRVPILGATALLERHGWPWGVDEFAAVLSRYCATKFVQTIQLDISFSGIGPRIGVEFFYESAPLQDRRWRDLFDKLVEDGACTPERRRRVEAWVGVPSPGRIEVLLRGLLVKLVYAPRAPLEAKAYLPFAVNTS